MREQKWEAASTFYKQLGYFDFDNPVENSRLVRILRQCHEISGSAVHFSGSESATPDDIFPLFAFQDQMFDIRTGKGFFSACMYPVPGESDFYHALARASVCYLSVLLYFFAGLPADLPAAINNAFHEHALPPFIRISRVDEGPIELTCSHGIVLPPQIAAEWAQLPVS